MSDHVLLFYMETWSVVLPFKLEFVLNVMSEWTRAAAI